MSHSQHVHDSISQIASIRLQTELLQMNVARGIDSDQTIEGLQAIVALTHAVQKNLSELLVALHEQEQVE